MDNKHFIWITPTILLIGFIIGYISGLSIPNKVTFEIDKDTREFMDSFSNRTINNECIITQDMCYNDIENKGNSYRYCVMNMASNSIIKINNTPYVEWEQLSNCNDIIETMPQLLY
jgi:hypothetical protein